MKRFLLTLAGPVAAAIAFLRFAYSIGQPTDLMFSLIVLSLLFALGIAFVAVHKHIARSPQFWRIGITSLEFCLVMACSWAVFWAISEELYIHYFIGVSSDMPGIERYIYPGNSGMGFARGIRELPRSLCEASLAAGILAILWTPVAFGLFALCNPRSKNGQPTASTKAP